MNVVELSIEEVLSYKIKPVKNYQNGGFYMIKNKISGKCYVGKSIDFKARLKQHTFKSNSKSLIDSAIKNEGLENFNFFILGRYDELGINFFNRKLETIIEHRLIKKFNCVYPNGYNKRYYGHL